MRRAHLPDAHVSHRGEEGFTEELADLIGIGSDLCDVVDEQQHSRQRIHTGEQTQIPKLHQELDVLCKQALWRKQEAAVTHILSAELPQAGYTPGKQAGSPGS